MKEIPERINKAINEFIEGVNNILGNRIKKIILYGSYARGDFNKNSDIDIMILTDLTSEELNDYSLQIWEICADIEIDNGIVISPLIRNVNNFNEWLNVKPFYINIVKEGVVLSEK